jgi:nitrogen fixation-related uncharacterized protein
MELIYLFIGISILAVFGSIWGIIQIHKANQQEETYQR